MSVSLRGSSTCKYSILKQLNAMNNRSSKSTIFKIEKESANVRWAKKNSTQYDLGILLEISKISEDVAGIKKGRFVF